MRHFLDSEDYAEWKRRCIKQRFIAAKNPCYEGIMATCEDYEISCGPEWDLRLVLETYTPKPIWHASISHTITTGGQTVYDKATGLPIFEEEQEAKVMVKDWTKEEQDVANSLLGDLLGPLIPTPDTRVNVHDVGFARHWVLDAQEVHQKIARRN